MLAWLLPLVLQTGPQIVRWDVEGVRRTAVVYAPTKKVAHPPLLIGLHGHGGNGTQFARSSGAVGAWPEAVMVFPNGLPTPGMTDPEGKKPGWQQNAGDQGDRDLKWMDQVLGWAEKTYGVDPQRRFVMGHSNGGRFTYLLWAERGDKFAGYGPSGTPGRLLVPQLRPAPAFFIAGEKDPLISYDAQKRTIDAIARKVGAGTWTGSGLVKTARSQDGIELGTYLHPGGHEYPKEGAQATLAFLRRISDTPQPPAPAASR